MSAKVKQRVLMLLLLAACGLGLALGAMSVLAQPRPGATAAITVRTGEAVVLPGSDLAALQGEAVTELWLYTFDQGVWQQRPLQVDEVTADGDYTATEDGLFDANDELVFMARDAAGQAPADDPFIDSTRAAGATWLELEITDPLSTSQQAWAYLVQAPALTPTQAADYIAYDPVTRRLTGETYVLGFAAAKPWADYLTLGPSQTDILDRNKLFLDCSLAVGCPLTEEALGNIDDSLIKDGPVRVILRGGRVLAYARHVSWRIDVPVSLLPAGDLRFSIDFNSAASGATLYSAVAPDGLTIDGTPDVLAAKPASDWFQVSTTFGTLIQVSDLSGVDGVLSNFYRDDSAIDADDTGDQQHFGDVGLYVENPGTQITYQFSIFLFDETLPAASGSRYSQYFAQPLQIQAQSLIPAATLFLPLVLK